MSYWTAIFKRSCELQDKGMTADMAFQDRAFADRRRAETGHLESHPRGYGKWRIKNIIEQTEK